MTNRERAEKIYNQVHPAAEQYRKMGMPLTPAMAATLDEIEAHLNLVDDVAREYGANLDASKIAFGASRQEIEAVAQSKNKANKRRAGVRALEQKYGHDAAARIVYKHSGRTIR